MERPAMLLETMLRQCSLDLDLSVERDVATMRRRYEQEGFSFLSLTLPRLSDALLQGIEAGRFTCPAGFSRHGSLPRFLGGFFNRLFSRDGEYLQNDTMADAAKFIAAIRQICDFWKKPKIPCTRSRERAAEVRYIAVEEELSMLRSAVTKKDKTLDAVAGILWSTIFDEVDPLDINCKHGPGNTADRRLQNVRNRFSWWYLRAEPWFPSALHCYPNYGYAAEAAGSPFGDSKSLNYVDEWSEPPVRVVFVPKTLKTPRVIALEPSPMQFMQQGLLTYIVPRLESHWLTKNSIRFSDQSVNQRLAHKASLDKTLTTLDLSDASDRVHVDLVDRLFKRSGIGDYLLAVRSGQADLPSGRRITLHKYASMGSATCFPVEAMVFYTIVQSAMHQQDGRRPSSRSIAHYSRSIDIYGDDIIVPVDYTDAVVHNLEAYGLRVNVNKSFRNSLFRESCGADYYNGEPVRPVYARELAPDDVRRWTANQVASWTATANQFYKAGQWKMAQVLREMLESVLRSTIPRATTSRGGGIAFVSLMFTTECRFNSALYAYEQKRTVYIPLKRKDYIDGDAIACLNKWGQQLNEYHIGLGGLQYHRERDHLRPPEGDVGDLSRTTEEGLRDLHREPVFSWNADDDLSELHQEDWFVDTRGTLEYRTRPAGVRNNTCRAIGGLLAEWQGAVHSARGSVSRLPSTNVLSELRHKRSDGLEFHLSAKRSAFKSKRYWVTTLS